MIVRDGKRRALHPTRPSTPHPPFLSLPRAFAARVLDARERLLRGEPDKEIERRHGAVVMRAARYED